MAVSWEQAAGLNEATKVIAVADVVESVRLMEQDEEAFIRRWQGFLGFVTQHVPRHAGRLHKSLGDGLMLEFSDPEGCILAARAMQEWFAASNRALGPEAHVHLRIGAHVARFVVDAYDIYGNDVNLAARIASLAGPGEIVISAALRNQLGHVLRAQVEDLGTCHLKHVRVPVHAFRIGQAGRAPVVPAAADPQAWRPLLAILPFDVHGHEQDGPACGETVGDDIVTALTRAGHVHIVSRLSTQQQAVRLRAVRNGLGPAYVLAGHVRCQGTRAEVFAELSDSRTGHVAWAQGFEGSGDALRMTRAADGQAAGPVRTKLAPEIAAAVQAAIVAHEAARADVRGLPALEGATLLLAAVASMHRLGHTDLERAQAMLEHLAERWPRHPEPHAWLSHLHLLRWQQEGAAESAAQARAEAAEALHGQPGSALGRSMAGRIAAHLDMDLRAADDHYAQVLAADPHHALALLFRAEAKALDGDSEAAQGLAERAAAALPLSPLNFLLDLVRAQAALLGGDPQQAVVLARDALERSPACAMGHMTLAAAQIACGASDEAQAIVDRLVQRGFDVPGSLGRMPPGGLRTRVMQALMQVGITAR